MGVDAQGFARVTVGAGGRTRNRIDTTCAAPGAVWWPGGKAEVGRRSAGAGGKAALLVAMASVKGRVAGCTNTGCGRGDRPAKGMNKVKPHPGMNMLQQGTVHRRVEMRLYGGPARANGAVRRGCDGVGKPVGEQ